METRVYSSKNNEGLFSVLRSIFRELPKANALGIRLAERNIRSKYRQSFLGIVWAFLPPLATAAVWIVLNKVRVVNFSNSDSNYPVFVITGIMLWSIFSASVLAPLQVMQSNRSILVKINFPREALLITAFYEILFTTLIASVIILAELLIFQVGIGINVLLYIPGVLLLICMGMALGIFLLPVSLMYKDIQFLLPTVLQFCMYLTPVLYVQPVFTGLGKMLDFNPVTPVLTGIRSWLLGVTCNTSHSTFLYISIGTLLLLVIGLFVQRATIGRVIERMGS